MNRALSTGATDLRTRFERDGYLVFPGFFPADVLAEINRELEAHYAGVASRALAAARDRAGLKTFECDVIPWDPVAEGNRGFVALRDHPDLAAATALVLGEGFTAPGSLVMYSVGGGKGQAWHQDCPDSEPGAFNLNRLIYTQDVSAADGAIVLVPGSHRRGRIPPGGHQDPMDGEIALTPAAGTLVFLHGHVYHRVTPNQNRAPRISVNFRAYPAGVPPTVNCVGVYRNGTVNFCDKPKRHDGTPAGDA